jgi:hypothetical protein
MTFMKKRLLRRKNRFILLEHRYRLVGMDRVGFDPGLREIDLKSCVEVYRFTFAMIEQDAFHLSMAKSKINA